MMVENGLYADVMPKRYTQSRQVTATTAGAAVIPNSAKRVRLEVRTSGGAVVIVFGSNLSNTDTLFRIATQYPILVLDKTIHGTLLQSAMSLQVGAGTELCTVTETMED